MQLSVFSAIVGTEHTLRRLILTHPVFINLIVDTATKRRLRRFSPASWAATCSTRPLICIRLAPSVQAMPLGMWWLSHAKERALDTRVNPYIQQSNTSRFWFGPKIDRYQYPQRLRPEILDLVLSRICSKSSGSTEQYTSLLASIVQEGRVFFPSPFRCQPPACFACPVTAF